MYKSNINLNLYKNFYEVAKNGSISEAAKKTYMSQPAISKSIKKLEEELNTKLFFRNVKGVELTEKGKELLFYIEQAYNNLIIAERNIIERENLERGKLSIGVPSQIGTFYIFENIAKFHKLYPNIEITIISKSTSQLLTLLQSHEIDFIIDTSPIKTNMEEVIIKQLKKVDNCFIAKKDSVIDYKNIHAVKDLEKVPLVLPIKGTDNRKELDTVFDKNNVQVKNIINIHTSEMIVGAVKKDLGLGYIIYDLVKDEIESGEFKLIDLKEKLPEITINLVYVKNYLTTAPMFFIKNFIDDKIEL